MRVGRERPVTSRVPPMQQGDSRTGVTQPHGQVDDTVLLLEDGPPAAEVDSVLVLPQDLLLGVAGA